MVGLGILRCLLTRRPSVPCSWLSMTLNGWIRLAEILAFVARRVYAASSHSFSPCVNPPGGAFPWKG